MEKESNIDQVTERADDVKMTTGNKSKEPIDTGDDSSINNISDNFKNYDEASNKDNLFFHAEINDDGSVRLLKQRVLPQSLIDKAGNEITTITNGITGLVSHVDISTELKGGKSILIKKVKTSPDSKNLSDIATQNELISYALNDRKNFTYRAFLRKFLDSYPFITADERRNISNCINGVTLIIGDPGSGKSAIDLKLSNAIANIKGLFHNSIIDQCNKYISSNDINLSAYDNDEFLSTVIDLFSDTLQPYAPEIDKHPDKKGSVIDNDKLKDAIRYTKSCILQYAHELKSLRDDDDEQNSIFKRIRNHSYTGHYSCQEPIKDIQHVFSKGTKVINPVNGFKYSVLSYDSVTSPMFSLGKLAAMSGGINLSNMKTTLALFDAIAAANNTSIILTVNSLGLEKNLTNALKVVADSMCSLVIDLNQSEIHVRESNGNRLSVPFARLNLKTPCKLDNTYKSDFISYPCSIVNKSDNQTQNANGSSSDLKLKFNTHKSKTHFISKDLEKAYVFNDLNITSSPENSSQSYIDNEKIFDANKIIAGSLFKSSVSVQDNMDEIRYNQAAKNPYDLKKTRLYSDNAGKMNTEVREIDLTELFPESSLNINSSNDQRSANFNSSEKDWDNIREGNDYVSDIANRYRLTSEISRTEGKSGLNKYPDDGNDNDNQVNVLLFGDAIHSNDKVLADYLDPTVSRELASLYGIVSNLNMIRADLAEYSTLPRFSKAAGFKTGVDEDMASSLVDKKLQLILLSAYSERFEGIDPFLTSKETYTDAAQYRNYLSSVYDAHVMNTDD